MIIVIMMHRQPDLFQIVLTRRLRGGSSHFLHGGQKQGNENGDDRDDDQQFDQGESLSARSGHVVNPH